MINDPVMVDDWHPVAHVRELAEGRPLAVRLLGEDLVLWRVQDRVLAWQDLCVHRGTRLSLGKVEGDVLVCPYHGWTYNDEGRCIRIPAHPEQTPPSRARVTTFQATIRYDLVWVALGAPHKEPPSFPEWNDSSYRKIFCGPYLVHASGPRIVENFLDIAHFPFVHGGILGDRDRAAIDDYESSIGPEGVVSQGVRVYQPDPYGTRVGDVVSYTYRVFRPLTAYLTKESEGPRFSLLLTITPHDVVESTAWMWMAMNYGFEVPEQQLVSWQDSIFAQDRPIVQSQRPELLPVDLQAELHLRSDRTAISYRKWLKELGLSFAVA